MMNYISSDMEVVAFDLTRPPFEPEVFFLGSEEEISSAEEWDGMRIKLLKDILLEPSFGALYVDPHEEQSSYLIHRSTRANIDFQLSCFGYNGEPAYHENYGEGHHSLSNLYKLLTKHSELHCELIKEL